MIDYELSPDIAATREQLHMLAEHAMRPIARCGYTDDYTVLDRLFQMARPR